jgi:hypothetical protein
MKTWVWFTGALLAIAGVGCGSDDASDSPAIESSPVVDEATASACVDDFESQVLDWSEPSPLGYGADDALAALGAEYRGTLTYADGTTTAVRLGLAQRVGTINYRADVRDVSSAPRPEGDISREIACPSGLSFPVTLSFQTDDGAFSEQWRFWLLSTELARATGDGYAIDLDELSGNYTLPDGDRYDDLDAQLTATFEPERWTGSLMVVATTLLSAGADGVVMVEIVPVGTF